MNDLLEVLKGLNPDDNSVWTEDGLPSLEAVRLLTKRSVTRAEINKVALGLTRTTVTGFVPVEKEVVSTVTTAIEEVVTKSSQENVQSELDKTRDEITKFSIEKQAIETKIKELTNYFNQLEAKLEKVDNSTATAEVLSGYVASVLVERQKKEENLRKLQESGLSVSEIKEITGLNRRRRK